jgi:hypothetical protein
MRPKIALGTIFSCEFLFNYTIEKLSVGSIELA